MIDMIAVVAHGLNGEDGRAKAWATTARTRAGALSTEEFFRAFPFRDERTRKSVAKVLARFGF